jgi:hypothetical protein
MKQLDSIALAGCLLLWLTTAAFWGRSYQTCDMFPRTPRMGSTFASSNQGQIIFQKRVPPIVCMSGIRQRPRPVTPITFSSTNSDILGFFGLRSGFDPSDPVTRYVFGDSGWPPSLYVQSISYWIILTAVSLPLLVWFCAWVRKTRRPLPGHCGNCGYDLRATPLRCPECGQMADVSLVLPAVNHPL